MNIRQQMPKQNRLRPLFLQHVPHLHLYQQSTAFLIRPRQRHNRPRISIPRQQTINRLQPVRDPRRLPNQHRNTHRIAIPRHFRPQPLTRRPHIPASRRRPAGRLTRRPTSRFRRGRSPRRPLGPRRIAFCAKLPRPPRPRRRPRHHSTTLHTFPPLPYRDPVNRSFGRVCWRNARRAPVIAGHGPKPPQQTPASNPQNAR
jgi:hypothetical protein